MDREHVVECKVQSPDNAAKANDDQGTIDKGTKSNLTKLSSDTALKNIANWVEGRIIGVTDEV
jgi:N-acetylglucosamine-6-phosphate deacetylase